MKHLSSLNLPGRAFGAASGHIRRMKFTVILTIIAVGFQFTARAQTPATATQSTGAATNATATTTTAPVHHGNALISPEHPSLKSTRATEVIKQATDHPGNYDIEFIGDAITQGWEDAGKNVWQEFYGKRKTINMGVSGDQPQHVLWRIEHAQLDGINAKAAVVMIGTNAADHHLPADILEGITTLVNLVHQRQPNTKIILVGLFPYTPTFSAVRGNSLQINQVLARLDDGKNIFFLDIGPQLITNDGAISQDMMHDPQHPTEAGYRAWANAMEPKLRKILGK
jgi:lysophospholipase L1-like esterase